MIQPATLTDRKAAGRKNCHLPYSWLLAVAVDRMTTVAVSDADVEACTCCWQEDNDAAVSDADAEALNSWSSHVTLFLTIPNCLQTTVHCTFCCDHFASTTAQNLHFYTCLPIKCLLVIFCTWSTLSLQMWVAILKIRMDKYIPEH